jgi:hypothetical protein
MVAKAVLVIAGPTRNPIGWRQFVIAGSTRNPIGWRRLTGMGSRVKPGMTTLARDDKLGRDDNAGPG